LREAEVDMDRRRVTAPIDGWVGLISVEQGDRITAQDAIAVITDRAQIQIDFRVPERHVAQLDIGTPIDVAPLADRDRVIRGEIVALDNQIDRSSRTLRVQGRIDNSEDRLRDGQAFAVTLTFTGDELPGVNPLSVQWSSEGSFVWVVRDDTAVRVPVTIRQRSRDLVLVEGELAPGDLVVTEGVQTLREGATVDVITEDAEQTDTTAAADRGRAI
jgi:RND family efflux transporter MFP subunit